MTTAAKKTTPKPAYSITTKRDGFRRADRPWVGTTEVLADELTDKQIEQLRNDQTFIVVEL